MAPTVSGSSSSSSSIIDGSGGGNQQAATVAQRLASLKTISGHHHAHHLLQPDDKWVPVSWMPHTTLSQTSHVCVEIRSALVVQDVLNSILLNRSTNTSHTGAANASLDSSNEWRVQATIQGLAGLHMVSSLVPCQTPAAVVEDSASSSSSSVLSQLATLGANRVCKWDRVLHLPMRWRDLPRDAYLQLEVVAEKNNQVIYRAFMPFFTRHGRLKTGLQRLELVSPTESLDGVNNKRNHGLYQPHLFGKHQQNSNNDNPFSNDGITAEDPIWKASCILDQLERFEERANKATATTTTAAAVPTGIGPATAATSTGTTAALPPSGTAASFGEIPSVPWLDALQKERCKQILAHHAAATAHNHANILSLGTPAFSTNENDDADDDDDWEEHKSFDHHHQFHHDPLDYYFPMAAATSSSSTTSVGCIIVELPVNDIPILFEEFFYPTPTTGASGGVSPLDMATYHKRRSEAMMANTNSNDSAGWSDALDLVQFLDYENENDNPVEDKYRTLAHDLLRGLVDPALKPDKPERDRLSMIIESPSHHPTREEKDLLWRFRFSLVDNRRALTKFLLAVDWTVDSEVIQAAELLEQWRKRSPIEVTDALKLLGKHVAFQTHLVRSYAIDTLAAAPDSELRLYLLQLVQALKYETTPANMEEITAVTPKMGTKNSRATSTQQQQQKVSSLGTFLINRAGQNLELANYLYWYLKVELQNPTHGTRYRQVFAALQARLSETEAALPACVSAAFADPHQHHPGDHDSSAARPFKSLVDSVSKLVSDATTPGSTAGGNKEKGRRGRVHARTMWDVLVDQDEFISGVMDVQQRCRDARGKKDVKEALLQSLLSKEGYDRILTREPIPLPSAPTILVNGVNPMAKMFKSALYPALLEFHVEGVLQSQTTEHKAASLPRSDESSSTLSSYKVIVKTGDDLRQDQLIIMMISLMDGLLKRAALDLCLTPYSVIAMSPTSGLVEFVDGSMPITQILAAHNGSVMQFFQAVSPHKGAKYNVRPSTMSTYLRSCAGYCVITYLLGVGDRHLDNILLRGATGHFFHIDFGFTFGRDPKPLPPAFRLTREMVDGMGGTESSEYRQFCALACQAYNALRKSAGLVLNLLHLSSDAGIEDLSNNPSGDVEWVIGKVEERFRLDLTDEQAERYFIGLINDCLAAIAPRVMDVFHSFSVARR